FFLMSSIVISLSIGMHISKMKCTDDGQLYLGTDVPSCSMEKAVVCQEKQEKASCCMIEVEKQCCLETKDKSCASETENIQFDFETLVSDSEFSFKTGTLLYSSIFVSNCFQQFKSINAYTTSIPPPKLNKLLLANIQSFLL
ncbi:MAG: hypothetical protein VYD33_05255, partial [Bacteroidota bacterium]|nr:hypothetical protein [Bacteroidota bacterium]